MSIYKQLFEAKKEIGKISKDSKNPFFKSKYFDINSLLEHVEPILQKHNLLLLQPIEAGKVTTEIIDIETGEKVKSEITLPQLNDPQKLGSCVSYYRRYTAQSLICLQSTDDDANIASGNIKLKQPSKKTPVKKDYKECTTKEELRAFYASISADEQSALKDLITEFALKLK